MSRWLSKALYKQNPTGRKLELVQKLNMWWHPPETPKVHNTPPASPDMFFLVPFFLWAPQRQWNLALRCTEDCQNNQNIKNVKVINYTID